MSMRSHSGTRQRGAALIVGLLMLLVATLIGLGGIRNALIEERMAGNTRQLHIAGEAAEAALREAEAWLEANVAVLGDLDQFAGAPAQLYSHMNPPGAKAPTWDPSSDADWLLGTNTTAATTPLGGVGQAPRYFIEYMGRVGDPPLYTAGYGATPPDLRQYAFRVTAMGWGADGITRSLLQSHYHRSLN